jgi:hypothetical protein
MQENFELMNDILRVAIRAMAEQLRTGLQKNALGAFQNEKEINPIYPTFEIFSYLLFQLDYFVAADQEEKIRRPLFHFIANDMFETLDNFVADDMPESVCMDKKTFDSILDKRMEEYGGILVDWNRREITYDLRNKKLLQGFLDNLIYSISKQDLYYWEGKIKPLPWTDANQVLIMHIIFKEMLLPIEIRFRKIIRNIFKATPDFTQLSTDKLEDIILQMEQDNSS